MGRRKIERNISYDMMRKTYYVYMDNGRNDVGVRVRQYKTFPTLIQARQALKSFHAERESTRNVSPRDMTLDQWLDYWMREIIVPNRAETTVYGYKNIIKNHLSDELGDIPIQKLSPQDLQQYYSMLMREKGLVANTVRRHHDLLSCALRMALRQDMILRCPTDRVEAPRVIPKEAKFYTPDNLKQLYQTLNGHWLELIVHLAGSLGLRREEICGLSWDSIDFEQRKLHIRAARTSAGADIILKETKNRSSNRVLYITDDLIRLLKRERTRQTTLHRMIGSRWTNSGLVIVDDMGKPRTPNLISMSFTRFIRTRSLPTITLHGLRHTFATVASAQGAPLFDIGKALGHSTPATTGRIYTHLIDQTHAITLDLVAAALR